MASTAALRSSTVTARDQQAARSAARGRMLVFFKRSIGVDPLASYFTLYTSGYGVATVVYGGRDGARVHVFNLSENQLRRLQRLLQHTRLKDAAIRNASLYTYWVTTDNASHRLQQGAVPRSARPLLRALTAIADANHLF